MATPPSSLDKWRDRLRDINFWLHGYQSMPAFRELGDKMYERGYVHWNVGVGPAASFTRAISAIALEAISQRKKFDHVIKVELKETEAQGSMWIGYQLALLVAEELGLLDQEEYSRLKEAHDELRYYSYGMDGNIENLEYYAQWTIVARINKQLTAKRYLLVVENLYRPIEPGDFSRRMGLPLPAQFNNSEWFITTTSSDACDKSKLAGDVIVSINSDDEVVVLILAALRQSAEHIFNVTHQEDEQYWHRIALSCFHYAIVLFAKHSPPNKTNNGNHPSCNGGVHSVNSDELIHQWLALGILINKPKLQETSNCCSKYHNVHQVGRVVLEAFQEYPLLQLPFSPTHEAGEATKSAAHFLLYHSLIAEGLTVHELSDDKKLERKKWISFIDDQGWHVSREWLTQEETSGSTALILRGCSQHSLLFSILDSCMPKLCFLRVLDLSYTLVNSLPCSIGYLLNLRLLSLRGCHDLKTLFISSTASTTNSTTSSGSYSPLSTLRQLQILDMNGVPFSHLTQDIGNQKSNLIHLDMSYSEVTTFPLNFFQGMSNLEVLILVKCPNLVELPPSMAALLNLTTLEISRTQIKSFPEKMFEEMHKLQSFSLISAPHMRCLSLHGCRKLASVDLRDLGALEDLDLSATAIRELPADIPNLPQLRRLLLMDVPSLRRFPWHKLQRLPDVFCLDHYADGTDNHSNQVAHVCISDSRLFHSFNYTSRDLVRDGCFFQSFYVRVAPPCIVKIRKMQDGDDMVANKLQELVQRQSTYLDVYSSYNAEAVTVMSPMTAPLHQSQTKRHVEISTMNRYPGGLHYLLQVTKSIYVTSDTSILHLSDLSSFGELEECALRWCYQMKVVFHYTDGLNNLRNMHVSNLKSLAHFYQPNSPIQDHSFNTLEHLHLEDCPRLEDMMPCDTELPCLKTLDILFCYNLKIIFCNYPRPRRRGYSSYQLPRLQRIHLQELPQLKHLHDDDAAIIVAPAWKELYVRGCWSLRHLPRLLQVKEEPSKVEVSGERAWWAKLSWDRGSYEPKFPQAFASFDERAEMTSYLREVSNNIHQLVKIELAPGKSCCHAWMVASKAVVNLALEFPSA